MAQARHIVTETLQSHLFTVSSVKSVIILKVCCVQYSVQLYSNKSADVWQGAVYDYRQAAWPATYPSYYGPTMH